jgi:hypothetical protein
VVWAGEVEQGEGKLKQGTKGRKKGGRRGEKRKEQGNHEE